jgi:hypothetical protein
LTISETSGKKKKPSKTFENPSRRNLPNRIDEVYEVLNTPQVMKEITDDFPIQNWITSPYDGGR